MDLISRQALRQAMYHEAFEVDSDLQKWDSGCWIRYKLFEKVIDNLPSAERTGEWIEDGYLDLPFVCSNCGFALENWAEGIFYNFCPNCGAKMERSEDERG